MPRRAGGCRASSLAALAMGGLLWLAARFVPHADRGAHGLAQAALLAILIAGAIAIYGLLAGPVRRHRLARSGQPRSGEPRPRDLRA